MIELCTIPKEIFKPFVGTICNFKKEVELNLDPGNRNITLRTIDSAKVALLEIELCTEPVELSSFQIPLGSLEKVVPKKDNVTVFHDGNVIVFKIDGAKFNIKSLDTRTSGLFVPPTPKLTWETSLNISKEHIEEIGSLFKTANNYTDNAIFEVKSGLLSITAQLTTEDNVEKPIEVPVTGPDCKSCIPTAYLVEAFENNKIYESGIISLGTGIPIKIELMSSLMNTKIMIAPRITDDD